MSIHIRTLGATTPDPKAARANLVGKLAIVMGAAQAEQTVRDLEQTVITAAEGAVKPVMIKAVIGVAAISLFFYLMRRAS